MSSVIFVLIAFLASTIGCICGIGGGVIIKPVLDAFNLYSVSAVSFMSGCIVLAMTAFSVVKALLAHESVIEKGRSTPLGIGAAVGGVAGKRLFEVIKASFANPNGVGRVQAGALLLITLATVIYTINKSKIRTHSVKSPACCVLIGLGLGIMSSFLGIGGGPINLVVLSFFFSMETKVAAQNSLYVILLSQLASLGFTVVCGNVPEFPAVLLLIMVLAGISGAAAGRKINKKIDSATVNKLFIGLMFVIIAVCVYNFCRYS